MTPPLMPEFACRDLKASTAFYVELLGFRVVYERPGFLRLALGGAEIMLEELSAETWGTHPTYPFGRGMHLQITVGNVLDLHARVAAQNVPLERPLEVAWYRADQSYVGLQQFVVADPDGYLLRFAEKLGETTEKPTDGRVVT